MVDPVESADDGPEHLAHVVLEMGMTNFSSVADQGRHLPLAAANFPKNKGRSTATAAIDIPVLASMDSLVDHLGRKLKGLTSGGGTSLADRPSICRVHPSIREQEPDAYTPKLVSIGPLHHGEYILLPMEQVKLGYLRDLLERSPENQLGSYVEAVRECEHRARTQYAEEVNKLTRDEFVEMMVVDGCFIIEYLVKRVFKETSATVPLSGVRWGFSHLRRDLLLLENQVPFFVLVKLFKQSSVPFHGPRKEPLSLIEIALRFLEFKLPKDEWPPVEDVFHLLHLQHMCMNPIHIAEEPVHYSCRQQLVCYPFKMVASLVSLLFFGLLYLVLIREWQRCFVPTNNSKVPRMIPSATELREAGIQFKRKDLHHGKVSYFLKVSFTDGTLEIPSVKVEESTSSKLRNLIALEQCFPHVGSHFTSYGVFMDNIINTEGDVAVLRSHGIIESKLGHDEEVAAMFNALCKGTHLKYEDHYNASLFKAVMEYTEFAHHRWRAALVHKYFNNPWTIISALAGILLLALTMTQTYFIVYPRK